jgi:hypothetical protein
VDAFWQGCWLSSSHLTFGQLLPKRLTTASGGSWRRTTRSPGIARYAGSKPRTEYTPPTVFRYQVIAEGGSGFIRDKILRGVLDAERNAIAQGDTGRSSIAPENYEFEPSGVDPDGLARVLLSPRRKERFLVAGAMFLQPAEGALVRVQGRLAKSPSFWVKNVDIVRSYERIAGSDLPVALESKADVRFFGPATLRMTYVYSEVDGHPVRQSRSE